MRALKLVAMAMGMFLTDAAHAQTGGSPAPATPPPPPPEMRGPDDRVTDFIRMQNDVSGRPTSSRPVPIRPEDVTSGSDVRDSKGALIGTVGAVGMGYAVVVSPGGKIEVEFASFAKNNKGLLINMPKAKFDAIVAGTAKPAN